MRLPALLLRVPSRGGTSGQGGPLTRQTTTTTGGSTPQSTQELTSSFAQAGRTSDTHSTTPLATPCVPAQVSTNRSTDPTPNAWVTVVRDALCDTFLLYRIPQRYADHTTHPLATADPRHDRKEVLLPTPGFLREEGFSCLPSFSMESFRVLMDSPEFTRWRRAPDPPWLPMPTVTSETTSSHGQIFLIRDSGWRVYRRVDEKGKHIEYLSKYLANWQLNPHTYKD